MLSFSMPKHIKVKLQIYLWTLYLTFKENYRLKFYSNKIIYILCGGKNGIECYVIKLSGIESIFMYNYQTIIITVS